MQDWKIWTPILTVMTVAIVAALTWWTPWERQSNDGVTEMVVYKTETCGCCNDWVDHVRAAGFSVTAHDISHRELNEKKRDVGLDFGLASCHTAFVGGYAIEGHVPAEEILRLLEERPDIAGLTVPGMPIGSPGMEHGDRQDAYDVLAFQPDGSTTIFASYHR